MHLGGGHTLRFLLLLIGVLLAVRGAAAEDFSQGLLWRIEAPGVAPGVLLGTLHASDRRVFRLPAAVRDAMDAAEVVAVEVMSDDASVRRFRDAMSAGGPQLPGLLGEVEYARVHALLAEAGVPEGERAYLKPWAALLIIAQPRDMRGPGLDHALLRDVRRKGKTVRRLETVEEQIAAFEGLPMASQLALLRHAAARYERIQAVVEPMIEAYLARDLAELFRLNAEAMGDHAAMAAHNALFLSRVLYERNERFAERLEPLLREGPVFAFFGALHLYGEHGVLALLARKGFDVRRID